MRAINWLGLIGGVASIALVVLSPYIPWWRLTVGEDLFVVNTSPFNFNFNFLGSSFTIPVILALNLSSILMLLISGMIMIVYSLNPSKTYSKRLLYFAYKKPMYSVILFLTGIIILTLTLNLMFNFNMPIHGDSQVSISNVAQATTIILPVKTSFYWPLWFAILTAIICIAARIYHKNIK
ncbi:MAG: hypothetical protein QXK78_04390 [Candidatus Bathyarchaeia archaeon]